MSWIILLVVFLTKSAASIMSPGFRGDSTPTIQENYWNPINKEMSSPVNVTSDRGDPLYFVAKNDGTEDKYVHHTVSEKLNPASNFPSPSKTPADVSSRLEDPLNHTSNSPQIITIQAMGIKNALTVKRSAYTPGSDLEYGGSNGPFCYDRYVTGNCRYRTDPEYCFQYEWTAYAIVQNVGGNLQSIRSEPEGLFVPSFETGQERVRVWVKTSCCTPYVHIISVDTWNRNVNACVVDVRELQGLHPAEIAGIVLGVLFVLIVIVVVTALIIRRRKARSISVGHTVHTHTRSREHVSRE